MHDMARRKRNKNTEKRQNELEQIVNIAQTCSATEHRTVQLVQSYFMTKTKKWLRVEHRDQVLTSRNNEKRQEANVHGSLHNYDNLQRSNKITCKIPQ